LTGGNRQHRPGGVPPHTGQSQDIFETFGKFPRMLNDDLTGCGMQLASPAVIAQAFPKPEDFLQVGGGQISDGGKSLHESGPIIEHGDHLRLLQHDLANPDRIRV
jgi:hypothetical protein